MKKLIPLLAAVLAFLLVLCFVLPELSPDFGGTEPPADLEGTVTTAPAGGSSQSEGTEASASPTAEESTEPTAAEQPTTEAPTTEAPTQSPTEPPTQPPKDSYLLSFAGDCTFADNYKTPDTTPGTFTKVVGTNYAYPFAKLKEIFSMDDLSLVNLECALTTYDPTPEEITQLRLDKKEFRFRGDPGYVQILLEGSIEAVTAANNHSLDYGWPGHKQTQEVLASAGVRYATWSNNSLIKTPTGLTVGIYATSGTIDLSSVAKNIQRLRSSGAEIVICSFHWGDERHYAPSETQQTVGRGAIDAGADIVFGHHPHVLQPIEHYNGGVILYSMGNFSFGGNRGPRDRDTAIIQQEILRLEDGTVTLGDTFIIPCCISSASSGNNFQPVLYDPDSEGFRRVLSKLDGTYAKKWLEEQQATAPTETETTAPLA